MWAIYAFLSAFFVAATDPIAKKTLSTHGDEYLVSWLMLFLSTPFLAIYYFSHRIAPFNSDLVKTLLTVIPLEILATILYYKALKLTDISLSVPFLALTPVFVILTAYLLLGEHIPIRGIFGIALITFGAYSLNLKEVRYGFISPIKAILSNRGSIYMVLVALIFSVTSAVAKKAMLCSSPESIPFIYNLSISFAMVPLVLYRLSKGYSMITKDPKTILSYLVLGLLAALSSICFFKSVSTANVAYAISIKRLSLLMSVGYGWIFFREREIRIRLTSTFCMFLGAILIII